MANIYNMQDTWNDAGITYSAIKMDVTDTASNSSSELVTLQIGSTDKFTVGKDGAVTMNNGVAGFGPAGGDRARIYTSGLQRIEFQATKFGIGSGIQLCWSTTSYGNYLSVDVGLKREAAGVLAVSDGSTGNAALKFGHGEVAEAYTVATLPGTPAVGMIARVTDGNAALIFGNTVVNSGAGATPYLVWYNGSNWTVIGA